MSAKKDGSVSGFAPLDFFSSDVGTTGWDVKTAEAVMGTEKSHRGRYLLAGLAVVALGVVVLTGDRDDSNESNPAIPTAPPADPDTAPAATVVVRQEGLQPVGSTLPPIIIIPQEPGTP